MNLDDLPPPEVKWSGRFVRALTRGKWEYASRANDISEGGVLVFAGIELNAGSEVFVEFTEPYSGDPIRARGIVRHRRGYNYGVEFVTETTTDQEQANKFRALLRMAGGAGTP